MPKKTIPKAARVTAARRLPARARKVGAAPKRRAAAGPIEIVARHPPVHPGAILRDLFLADYELTAYALAKACRMNRSKVERIVREDLGISGDTAVRLGRFFGNGAQFWMNLQARYEVLKAEAAIGDELSAIEPVSAAGVDTDDALDQSTLEWREFGLRKPDFSPARRGKFRTRNIDAEAVASSLAGFAAGGYPTAWRRWIAASGRIFGVGAGIRPQDAGATRSAEHDFLGQERELRSKNR